MRPDDFRVGLKLVATNSGMKGVPVKIVCINLPFIVTESCDGEAYTFDVRRTSFVRASERFWKVMKLLNPDNVKKQRTEPDRHTCPFCGGRIVERLIGDGHWQSVCRDCGAEGEFTS